MTSDFVDADVNAYNTELIWFSYRPSLSRLKPEDRTLEIGATVVKPTEVVRDLSDLTDHEVTCQQDGQHLLLYIYNAHSTVFDWKRLAISNKWFLGPIHPSPQRKRHLNRFIRFCRAHYVTDRQTDRQTTQLDR